MVYDHIIDDNTNYYIIPNKVAETNPTFSLVGADENGVMRCRDWTHSKQYMEEYTGPTFSQELKERWHKKSTFHFDMQHKLACDFLSTDMWATNTKQVNLVSRITFHVKHDGSLGVDFSGGRGDGKELSLLKAAKHVDLRISTLRKSSTSRWYNTISKGEMVELFEEILPAVDLWLAKGWKVKLLMDKKEDFR